MSSKIPRGESIPLHFCTLLAISVYLTFMQSNKANIVLTILCVFQVCSYLQKRRKRLIKTQQLCLRKQMLPKSQTASLNLKKKMCQGEKLLINLIEYKTAYNKSE